MYFGPGISVGRRGISYGDSDAQAFISATGLTGATEVNAVNNLVANLKTYGLWSKMKAIYPFVSDQKNLLNYTEDLTNIAWSKQQASVLGDQTTAPDGTLTADKVVENTATDTHRVYQGGVTVDTTQTYTYSFYVKPAGRTAVMIRGIAGTDKYAYINISNGTLISGNITPTITSAGNGWYRCSISFQPTSTSMTCYMFLSILDNPTYTGDGTSGVYLWGEQLEISPSVTSYQKTVAMASSVYVQQFKYNLKDPRDLDAAFRLAFNGTWAYSKQGALPNGSNAYANTYLNMASVLTNNNNHMSFYSRTNSAGSFGAYKMEMGVTDNTTHSNQISPNYQSNLALYENGSTVVSITNTDSTGMYIGSTTSSTSGKLYKNNTILGSSTTLNIYSLFSNNIFLSATNVSSGNVPTYYSNREKAFTTIGDGLTDTEATNLYTSVQQFNQDLSRQVGVPIVSDSDAQSFLNAAQITDITQANAINTLVVGLKNASLWTKMKAIYPFVGGTATSHKWNLKDPRDLDAAYRLAFYGAWTHSSTGALPNGVNAYANSYFNPLSNAGASGSMGFYCRTNTASGFDIGCNDPSRRWQLNCKFTDGNAYGCIGNLNFASALAPSALGFWFTSNLSNATTLYKNGSLLSTITSTYDKVNGSLYICAANWSGSVLQYSDHQTAFAHIGDGLNNSEASTLYTLVQNFQTTLGRQV